MQHQWRFSVSVADPAKVPLIVNPESQDVIGIEQDCSVLNSQLQIGCPSPKLDTAALPIRTLASETPALRTLQLESRPKRYARMDSEEGKSKEAGREGYDTVPSGVKELEYVTLGEGIKE